MPPFLQSCSAGIDRKSVAVYDAALLTGENTAAVTSSGVTSLPAGHPSRRREPSDEVSTSIRIRKRIDTGLVGEENVGALLREPGGNARTETGRRAGDKCDFSAETKERHGGGHRALNLVKAGDDGRGAEAVRLDCVVEHASREPRRPKELRSSRQVEPDDEAEEKPCGGNKKVRKQRSFRLAPLEIELADDCSIYAHEGEERTEIYELSGTLIVEQNGSCKRENTNKQDAVDRSMVFAVEMGKDAAGQNAVA